MEGDLRGEEIAALLNEIKQRVRARYPSGSVAVDSGAPTPFRIPLPDLMPLVHARDAAQAKMAAIGSVNPRRGGALNSLIQAIKKAVARAMSWFVRDQITFNRETIACVESALEALREVNSSLSMLAGQFNLRAAEMQADIQATVDAASQFADARDAFTSWRTELERGMLAVHSRLTGIEAGSRQADANYRESLKHQHDAYLMGLDKVGRDIQVRLWADLEKVRVDYERLIHAELRLIRQRTPAATAPAATTPTDIAPAALPSDFAPAFDYRHFAERFRGPESYVRRNHKVYLPYFQGKQHVLDVGCGRGEFLDILREHGIPAKGIELSEEDVAYCREKVLDVERADLFTYLSSLPESALDGIFSSQVVEHIDPARLPEMIRLCASRLQSGGLLVLETPNPECLAIFASHFYLDPTHKRPVPSGLLQFYMEECGMGSIQVQRLSPAVDSFPEIRELPREFAARFFGGLDYAIFGRKL